MDVTFFGLSTISVERNIAFIGVRFNGPVNEATELVDETIDIYIDTKKQAYELISAGHTALALLEEEDANDGN